MGGGLFDSVLVLAYHTYHTYILTYSTIWDIPNDTFSYGFAQSRRIAYGKYVGKLTVLTILTILTYLLTIPYGIYRMMPSPTDSPSVVESLMVSMYGKYVSMVSNSEILSYALPPRPCYSYTAQQRDS